MNANSVVNLFFLCRYPYNNALHHHVESIVYCCLESKNSAILDHLFLECNLVGKILQTEKRPTLFGDVNEVIFQDMSIKVLSSCILCKSSLSCGWKTVALCFED